MRSWPCQRCAKPGHFFCTSKNGSVFCNITLQSLCMGVNSKVACPCNYLCELHSNGEAATVKFCCNFWFECGPCAWWRPRSRDLFDWDGCSKKLCKFHAVRTLSLYEKTAFQVDTAGGLCRQCCRHGEAFERVLIEVARAMLSLMCGELDPSKWSQWSVETVKAAVIRKNNSALKKASPVVNAAHRFCTLVFTLISGGLCWLAQQLIECVVLINLALKSVFGYGCAWQDPGAALPPPLCRMGQLGFLGSKCSTGPAGFCIEQASRRLSSGCQAPGSVAATKYSPLA